MALYTREFAGSYAETVVRGRGRAERDVSALCVLAFTTPRGIRGYGLFYALQDDIEELADILRVCSDIEFLCADEKILGRVAPAFAFTHGPR